MSASRIARAGRSRFFIGLGIIILTMGFVAIFQSSQQQLNELRRLEMRCEQEQKLLGNQLEDASRSLKAERNSNQRAHAAMLSHVNEQKDESEKNLRETNLKLTSLQQHFKLLKSEHDDAMEACAKAKAKHLDEINALQRKLQGMETYGGQTVKEKDKLIELLKAKNTQLLNDKAILEKVVNEKNIAMPEMPSEIDRLQHQIEQYKEHTAWRPSTIDDPTASASGAVNQMEHPQDVQTNRASNNKHDINFSEQISVSDNLYQIPMKILNHNGSSSTTNNSMSAAVDNVNLIDRNINSNAYSHLGYLGDGGGGRQIVADSHKQNHLGVINSVENFQLMQKPLGDPLANAAQPSSSTAKIGNAKTSEASMNGKFEIPNAPMPEQLKLSSTTAANRRAEENFGKPRAKQVPNGVVPIQVNLEEMINRDFDSTNENAAQNNRYVNVADAMVAANVERKKAAVAAVQNNDANDANVAREVNDNNDFIVYDRSHKGHMPAAPGDNKFNVINNAAEEDMNLYDNNHNHFHLAKANGARGDDGDMAGQRHRDGAKQMAHNGLNANGKLLNEIDADGGRVAYADGADDAHMEEQLEEEGEDDDEYANPAAHKEPAVRN